MNEYEKNTTLNNTDANYNGNITNYNASNINNDNISGNGTVGEIIPPKKNEKKGNNKLIIFGIIFLLLLAVIGVLVYYKLVSSKNIFKTLINDTFTYLEENINDKDTISGTFSLKVGGTSSDSSANNMLELISKIELSGDYGIDYKNKIINLALNSKYENEQLLNANIYMENSNGYVELKEIYDKYIRVPLDDYDNLFSNVNNSNDYKIILKSINKALNNSLKDDYFTKEKTTVNNIKVIKTTLSLSEENYNYIKKDIINELINNNKFLKSLSTVTDASVEDIKTELNEYLENDNFEGINISIYTKGLKNEFVKFEIADSSNSIVITRDNDIYSYELTEDEKITYDGYLKVIGNENDVTCNFVINDKEENNKIDFTVTSSAKYNETINKVDVSNSIDYEELTTEDTNSISTNILKNETIMKLFEDVSNLSTNSVIGTDTNYDIDDYNITG